MTLIATLIANPTRKNLSPELARMASASVNGQAVEWLEENIACDIILHPATETANANTNTNERIRHALAGEAIDVVIHDPQTRRKKALIADMDSTMIDQECIDELAAEIGIKERVAAITAKAMNGEIEFEAAVDERVALLKGLSADITDKIIAERITLASGGK
ncbi:MAG: phosphoserine phosphatase SerB, partial [Pseudomonadota bacterium]